MNAEAVVDGVRAVAAKVQDALRAGELPVVLGGDCTVGVGTVAGAVAAGAEPRLVYLDLHPDLNTPQLGPRRRAGLDGRRPHARRRGRRRAPRRRGPAAACCSSTTTWCSSAPDPSNAPRPSAPRSPRATCGRSASTRCAPIRRRRPAPPWSAPRPVAGASSCTSTSTSSTSPTCRCRRTPGAASASASRPRWRPSGVLLAHDALLGLTVTELNPHHGAQDGADVARLARALDGRAAPAVTVRARCAIAQASELASTAPRAKGAASATAKAKITALDSEVPRAT